MISTLTIDGREYNVAAGPSIDKSFLVALVRNGSRAPILMLDVDLSLLRQLEIDRKQSRIKVSSQPEKAAVNLDFRRTASDIVIDFPDLKALAKVLKQLPTILTETPDSQIESSQRGAILLEPIFIDNSNHEAKRIEDVAEGEVEIHVDEDEVVEEQNARDSDADEANVSSELSIFTPHRESFSSPPRRSSRRSVTKTYSRGKFGRFTGNPERGKDNQKDQSLDTQSAASSDNGSKKEGDNNSHEVQESQRITYDSPPPGGENKPRAHLRAKTASASRSRKRNRDDKTKNINPTKRSLESSKLPLQNQYRSMRKTNQSGRVCRVEGRINPTQTTTAVVTAPQSKDLNMDLLGQRSKF